MKSFLLVFGFLWVLGPACAQNLKLKSRKENAMGGKDFAHYINDSTLSLQQREEIIFKEVKSGNVPNFLRKFKTISDTINLNEKPVALTYKVLPDYFAIGSNTDFFYVPMTPILAQRIANLLKCSLPTKKIVDDIYAHATIKLEPSPIPPTKAMITVPVFILHNELLVRQLQPFQSIHMNGALTAGNKKDIIISNRIYTEKTAKVVIYGLHKLDGKAIQPVYNKHTNLWADYSHGARFISNKIWIDGKKVSLAKLLNNAELCFLISDEGTIAKPWYPITAYN